jgi:hypothetical protein
VRRALAGIVALAALGGAAVGGRALEQRRVETARGEAERAAATASQRAADRLRLSVQSLEIQASAATTLQPLLRVFSLLRDNRLEQISDTLRNWFSTEVHWKEYRERFKVYGVSVEGDKLQLVEGLALEELDVGTLVRQAREGSKVSGTVTGKGWPYAAAAAPVIVPGLSQPVIIFLARPYDEAMLREAADRAGGAVLLSDGKSALAGSGAKPELDRLAAVVGRELGTQPSAEDGSWAAAAAGVAPKLWLWVHGSALANARAAAASTAATRVGLWAGAGLIAAISLIIGLRRGRPSASAPPVQATINAPVVPPAGPTPPPVVGAAALGPTMHAGSAAPPVRGPGQPFGRYLLLDRLGEGGMAQVYTAVTFGAEGFRRRFVVKRLRPELMVDQAVVAQFIDEANLASTLVHSNIVPVFDFGKEGEEYYLATEYILGRDLGRIVRQMMEVEKRALPVALVLFCALETLKALEYAHTKHAEGGHALGLVHRDVSPNNILVSARGEVKLFDFGIVKAEGRVTRTQHGVVKGNVSFMSPEQARGGEIDARADLFSLGLVLHYCLTGEVLYRGNTTYELLLKAATGPGPEEKARIAVLPAPAGAIIGRALETDPALRYASAAEFAAAVAPHVRATGGELAAVVQRLFGDEFRDEERRFAAAPAVGAVSSSEARSRQS